MCGRNAQFAAVLLSSTLLVNRIPGHEPWRKFGSFVTTRREQLLLSETPDAEKVSAPEVNLP